MKWLIDASAARHSGALTQHLGFLPALDDAIGADECVVLASPELEKAIGGMLHHVRLQRVAASVGWNRFAALNSRIREFSREFQPDAILFGQYAPVRATAPYVLRMTDAHLVDHAERNRLMRFYSFRDRLAWRAKLFTFRRSLRAAGAVLCATRAVRDQLQADAPWFPADRLIVAPYGPSPLIARAARHPANAGMRLLSMHVSPRKNVETILAAMTHPALAGATLTVLGDLDRPRTAYARFLAEKVSALGLSQRVRSAGYVSDEDALIRIMLQHDMLLCPSRIESWSHTVVEALGIGMPVIASDNACHREVADGAAWLVAADDDDALAATIARVAAGGPDVADRIDRGLRVVRNYDWDAYAAGALAALRTAAASV